MGQLPIVSVVLVNYRGLTDTLEAIDHLRSVEWPAESLDIIVVDNASGDDSVSTLSKLPGITVVASPTNRGFAGGCNLGVQKATGEVVAFLNNDAKPHPHWISAAMATMSTSPRIGAIASSVFDWDGKNIDYQGSAMAWYGMGYRPLTGRKRSAKTDPSRREVLFGTGSAMFVRRDVFEELGGFDERFFMFFEDVDFGWRLNLAGWSFVHEPDSIAFHKFHQSMSSIPPYQEQFLLERNALFALIKNIGEDRFPTVLAGAMLASNRRALTVAGLDSGQFDLARGPHASPEMSIPADALVPTFAFDQVIDALPGLMESRAEIQGSRKVSDAALWRLFGEVNAAMSTERKYLQGYDKIVEALRVTDDPPALAVLVITGDPLGANMSGPGIRAWNIAKELAKKHDVTLVTLSELTQVVTEGFTLAQVAPGDEKALGAWEKWADVIVFQGHALDLFRTLQKSTKRLVVDVYDPMHFEQLEQSRHLSSEAWDELVSGAADSMERQFLRGDFFLCATDRQKHLYLGQLMTLGRITTSTYADDPHLDKLMGVVPFGLPEEAPHHAAPALRGVVPGIGKDDAIILWSGGLYNWFDPFTLIRAVHVLSEKRPNIRLYFQGTQHPHPGVPEMPVVAQARDLATSLGILDSHVFFNDSWVPYATRANYLLEADLGVSTHRSHIETTFSFRTRILDYLWANLPMVVTDGDYFGDLVHAEGLGRAVPAEDIDALVEALDTMLFNDKARASALKDLARVAGDYQWPVVLAPLVKYLDRVSAGEVSPRPLSTRPVRFSPRRPRPPRFRPADIGLAFQRLFRGEFSSLWRALLRRLRPSGS
jgi:GT2 family glycosyltransferase/glycosyltransferase involved in cell wall biosynthesis